MSATRRSTRARHPRFLGGSRVAAGTRTMIITDTFQSQHWRYTVRVRDLLEQKPSRLVTVEPTVRVDFAISQMTAHDVGGLPVTAGDGRLVGFVGERDIVRSLRTHGG